MVPAEIAHVDRRENDVPILREAIEHELRVSLAAFGACASTTFGVPAAGRATRTVCATARQNNKCVHLGRVFGFCVEKGAQLPKGHTHRVFKSRVVSQGNDVKYQNYEHALLQDRGSNHASRQAGKQLIAMDAHRAMTLSSAKPIKHIRKQN